MIHTNFLRKVGKTGQSRVRKGRRKRDRGESKVMNGDVYKLIKRYFSKVLLCALHSDVCAVFIL